MTIETNKFYNADCLDIMRDIPDKSIDLVLTDPPYGIGEDGSKGIRTSPSRPNSYLREPKYINKGWDKTTPSIKYFNEIFRISKNQILFGANHYISKIPFDSSCWIVWDKNNLGSDFADCELAWTSFKSAVRKYFGHKFIGLRGGKDCIHPTQKPVKLFEWILKNYSKENQTILDCFSGSGTTAIACHNLNRNFICIEKDKEYFDKSVERYNKHIQQLKLI